MRLRVATLNVQNNSGDDRRMKVLSHELNRLQPDLIALQEVSYEAADDGLGGLLAGSGLQGSHQAQVMAYRPPWSDRYGGSAVATRWPHEIVEVLDLRSADTTDVPWCTLATRIDSPAGELLFIATTLSWRLNAEAARERQVAALADLDARHRRPLPTIIAGDFNAEPDAASIRFMTGRQPLAGRSVRYHDAWEVAGDGPGFTWSVDNPLARQEMDHIVRQPNLRRRLDYIFIGSWDAHPDAHCHIQRASLALDGPVDGLWLSDHCAVVADLEIGAGPA